MKKNYSHVSVRTAAAILAVVFAAMLATSGPATAAPKPAVPPVVCSSLANTEVEAGDEGPAVTALQKCLNALGLPPGPIDGEAGSRLTHAVITFQKWKSLSRDGVAGSKTLAALRKAVRPSSLPKGCDKEEDLACVVKSRQIMYLRKSIDVDSKIYIVDVSTGNGEEYETTQGEKAKANTPSGHATICRKIDGKKESSSVDNGILHHPSYINYDGDSRGCTGWAVHGAKSVPAYPASHGCIRVTMELRKWVFSILVMGARITIKQ